MINYVIELSEAWSLWHLGKLNDTYILWEVEIYWWGRIGKLMQAIAIVTIIIELVGSDKLIKFGESLHSVKSFRHMKLLIVDSIKFQFIWLKSVFFTTLNAIVDNSWTKNLEKDASEKCKEYMTSFWNMIINIVAFFAILIFQWDVEELWNINGLTAFMLWAFFFYPVSGIVTMIVIVVLSIPGILVDFILIKPLAIILKHKKLDKVIKFITIILGISGIHFDLLAS